LEIRQAGNKSKVMECTSAPVDHLVWFYEERSHLIARVAEFAAEGLAAGEHVILIATADHLRDIEANLASAGADTASLQTLDARATLAAFYRDGAIDPAAFDHTIGSVIRAAAARGTVRAFGEMVALLWGDGAGREAIALEALWCGLRETEKFTLLCAYPSGVVLDEELHAPLNAVCALHGEIRIGDEGEPTTSMRVYPPTPQAVREARRFVQACLGEDGPAVEDALLVTSELTSNALRHARTPFAVHVTLLGNSIRVAVRDASPEPPRLLSMAGNSESGRGIGTVAAISNRWGVVPHAAGKTVWAELPL
jgi:anti-sigma regulatory factor (Ser/Thr protein kinase)